MILNKSKQFFAVYFWEKVFVFAFKAHDHLVFFSMDGSGPAVFTACKFHDLKVSLNYWWLFLQFARNVVDTAFLQGQLLNNADHVVDVVDPRVMPPN